LPSNSEKTFFFGRYIVRSDGFEDQRAKRENPCAPVNFFLIGCFKAGDLKSSKSNLEQIKDQPFQQLSVYGIAEKALSQCFINTTRVTNDIPPSLSLIEKFVRRMILLGCLLSF
jgi:hypothetical protein